MESEMESEIGGPFGFQGVAYESIQLFAMAVAIARIGTVRPEYSSDPAHIVSAAASMTSGVATALLALAGGTCTLDKPPSEIDVLPDPETHWLILQCRHNPRHRWSADGSPRP